jgi:hypothetical protein
MLVVVAAVVVVAVVVVVVLVVVSTLVEVVVKETGDGDGVVRMELPESTHSHTKHPPSFCFQTRVACSLHSHTVTPGQSEAET